ncbi:hypothetical protein EI94DRAFT_1017972 [Lactarius quietus]|nr:hypothetical protein EI94DRAFT_1017972 [Lactarius quietus]
MNDLSVPPLEIFGMKHMARRVKVAHGRAHRDNEAGGRSHPAHRTVVPATRRADRFPSLTKMCAVVGCVGNLSDVLEVGATSLGFFRALASTERLVKGVITWNNCIHPPMAR